MGIYSVTFALDTLESMIPHNGADEVKMAANLWNFFCTTSQKLEEIVGMHCH